MDDRKEHRVPFAHGSTYGPIAEIAEIAEIAKHVAHDVVSAGEE
ncbi:MULTISPECIES: hypothetical protein [unclassified Streptomyces]|nr:MULTISPECIES: hypothetical protein [unclassified Streptomyces]